MFKHILVPVDGSNTSEVAVGKAIELAKAFGMRVIFHNRSIKTEIPLGFEQKSLHDVFSESDFVSINCPLTAETAEFVNASLIQLMKPTAVLINTGRGGLINEPDLSEALNSGKIAAACLDVLSNEPPSSDNPLLRAKNCFVTPHIGWATNEARQRLMDIAVDNLRSFMAGQPKNVVK
jgi:glycerate dehydrogenase